MLNGWGWLLEAMNARKQSENAASRATKFTLASGISAQYLRDRGFIDFVSRANYRLQT
jgi:hypothetical protein